MMRRLARKTREKHGGRTQSESNTVQNLARLAGVDLGKNVPGAPKEGGRRLRRSRSRTGLGEGQMSRLLVVLHPKLEAHHHNQVCDTFAEVAIETAGAEAGLRLEADGAGPPKSPRTACAPTR